MDAGCGAGGPRLAAEMGAAVPVATAAEERGETAVLLGEDARVLAVFGLGHQPRPQAADSVRALQEIAKVDHVVMLSGDELDRLPEAILHSRRTLRVMRQNVTFSLVIKALFVALAPVGLVSLVLAVAVDMGVSLRVTLNGLRLLGSGAGRQVAASPERDSRPGLPSAPPGGDRACDGRCGSADGKRRETHPAGGREAARIGGSCGCGEGGCS